MSIIVDELTEVINKLKDRTDHLNKINSELSKENRNLKQQLDNRDMVECPGSSDKNAADVTEEDGAIAYVIAQELIYKGGTELWDGKDLDVDDPEKDTREMAYLRFCSKLRFKQLEKLQIKLMSLQKESDTHKADLEMERDKVDRLQQEIPKLERFRSMIVIARDLLSHILRAEDQ